ncbi:hypothetical protein DFS34DRAFT_654487 [Phlyctochytrium arcticum]|nr:hypothetical protein DFS34DRAFT_654487 [Phlyctochytrium arcticum]
MAGVTVHLWWCRRAKIAEMDKRRSTLTYVVLRTADIALFSIALSTTVQVVGEGRRPVSPAHHRGGQRPHGRQAAAVGVTLHLRHFADRPPFQGSPDAQSSGALLEPTWVRADTMDAELGHIQARQTLKTAGQALRTASRASSLENLSDAALSLMTGTTVRKVGGYVGHLTDKMLSTGDGGDGGTKSTTTSGDSRIRELELFLAIEKERTTQERVRLSQERVKLSQEQERTRRHLA